MNAPKVKVGQRWKVFGFKESPTYEVYHINERAQFAMMMCTNPMSSALIGAALHLFNNEAGGYELVRAPTKTTEGEGQ